MSRKEKDESFAELCPNLTGILVNVSRLKVYVLQFHRGDIAIPCAGKERECDEGMIAACKMINRGVPLEVARDILGHADFRSTLVYARIKKERLQEAVRIFNG